MLVDRRIFGSPLVSEVPIGAAATPPGRGYVWAKESRQAIRRFRGGLLRIRHLGKPDDQITRA